MEKTASVQQQQKKKGSKQAKAANAAAAKNKKQLKVVYISNPMKVETSPSEFMALVQELTGQDADVPDPFKFPASPGVGGGVPDGNKAVVEDHSSEVPKSSDLSSEAAAAADYVPQLIENLPGIMPSNMWYD